MKKWKRISIGLLLFITFCMAGFFTGFRYGLSDGVDAQVESRIADRESTTHMVIYHVHSITLSSPERFDALVNAIRQSVPSSVWSDRGGPCRIVVDSPDAVLITASRGVHDQVEAYLAGRREAVRIASGSE